MTKNEKDNKLCILIQIGFLFMDISIDLSKDIKTRYNSNSY